MSYFCDILEWWQIRRGLSLYVYSSKWEVIKNLYKYNFSLEVAQYNISSQNKSEGKENL